MATCAVCGKDFVGERSTRMYCSKQCSRLAERARKEQRDSVIEIRNCKECGKEYKTSDSRMIFCEPRCKFTYRNRMKPKKQQPDRECLVCKRIFTPVPVKGNGRLCCSDLCTHEHEVILQRERVKRMISSQPEGSYEPPANIYLRKDRIINPTKYRNKELIRNYGITLDQYNEMLKKQNGVCAICGQPETAVEKRSGKARSLAVDHCHKEGHVRALLCTGCNQGLGNFKDSIEILNKAIAYLT